VLKAGAAYVPMDPSYPQGRIDYILADTQAAIILSQRRIGENNGIQLPGNKVLYIDLMEKLYQQEDTSGLPPYSTASDLAYVIYTSGTTGKPKGVMVEHGSVNNLVFAQRDKLEINAGSKILQFASLVFDASVWEIFSAISFGAALFIVPSNIRQDAQQLSEYLEDHGINIATIPPGLLRTIPYKEYAGLRTIIVAGESCSADLMRKWSRGRRLINAYGPTESTVCASLHEYKENDLNTNVGKPLDNSSLYVLDNSLIPVPIGVAGELHIGGAGLARGYLNNEALTAAGFIPNPFATGSDREKGYTRLYKTGDLVRWLADGSLEFIGRNDGQVKIRGHRIELGEIEHALMQISGVKQSCVLVRERPTGLGSTNYLAGYYVWDGKYLPENDSNILNGWEKLYDSAYDRTIEGAKMESDFSGWDSYITGKPIPLPEMLAWRDDILAIIKRINPCNVLEIGVGSGLLMYPLLKSVQRYSGLDISQTVIDRHKEFLKGQSRNVELYHLRADQIDQLPGNELYDMIIVNSVCQYFPGIGYFEDMLDEAIGRLSETGSIFLGDIRNYDLHKELIKEKFEYKHESYTQQDIDRAALKENELLISPDYFINLRSRYENINVDILCRDGSYINELSKYRYDVVISGRGGKMIKGNPDPLMENPINNHNVPFPGQPGNEIILKQLSDLLPGYMVPDVLVSMGSFPLTINGKLDKKALPDPEFRAFEGGDLPTTDIGSAICRIWQETLGSAKIGVTDDFFKLGGNSILAIQASHRMSKVLGCEMKVADILKYKTISQLLEHSLGRTQITIPKTDARRAVLSFAQERLWFIEQYEQGTNVYHMPIVFELEEHTDIAGIKYALQQIVSRHEI